MIKITDKRDCVGCEACRQACPSRCITMQEDNEGFIYPCVEESRCTDCELCTNVCPIIDKNSLGSETKKVYAAKNRNVIVQSESTSGGAFTPFVNWILSRGGVIFGAGYNDRFEVVHSRAENETEALRFRGSKYVQSRIGDTYKEVRELLIEGRYVLFSGTPCQIAGLRLFLRMKFENLFCIDIICHGVPSPKVFRDYVAYLQENEGEISSINMRSKEKGWRESTNKIIFANGKESFNGKLSMIWLLLYFRHFITRPCCHRCLYTNFNRQGDVTIGDFWGIERSHPDFLDERGVSLIMINTKSGEELFDKVWRNFLIRNSSTTECLQPMLYKYSKASAKRENFWRDYEVRSFGWLAKKYGDYSIKNRIGKLTRKVIQQIKSL